MIYQENQLSSNQRHVCLHYHIFKNAGTTIEWILKKNFSKNAVSIDTNNPKGTLFYEEIIDYLEKNSNVKSLSSHQIRFPLPKHEYFKFLPILFLRNPIDRVFSIYSFQKKRTDSDLPGVIKAKELNLNNYLKWAFTIKKFRVIKNFQVIFLSDKGLSSIVDENDLRLAIKRVLDCLIIGIVDRFDESLVLAEVVLQKYFPKIDLSYVKQNVSMERKGDLIQRINKDKSLIDKSVWEQLLKENEFDDILYKEANAELDRRLKKIENLNEKLDNFRKRCDKLQAVARI